MEKDRAPSLTATRSALALAVLASLAVNGCHSGSADRGAEEARLMEVSREWARAAASGNVDSILDYWADDAVVMMPDLPTFRGKQAIRSYVQESFKIPGFKISWEPLEAEISKSGDLGYLLERTEVTLPDEAGKLRTHQSRSVTIWRKDSNGNWRNVVDISNAAAPRESGSGPAAS